MSFSNDFRAQWLSFTNYLVSAMIKDSMSINANLYSTASNIYKNEILRWELDGQYNSEWLKALEKADPAIAARFSEELRGFQFSKIETKSSSNALNYILPGGGAVVGIGAGLLFKLGTLPTIAIGTALTALGGFASSKISDNNKLSAVNADMEAYKDQLKDLGDKLFDIVKKADGEEPFDL